MPATHAIVDYPVFMQPDSAIDTWHQVIMAVLAHPFLE